METQVYNMITRLSLLCVPSIISDFIPSLTLKALGQYISGIRLLNLNTAVTEQVNGNSTT